MKSKLEEIQQNHVKHVSQLTGQRKVMDGAAKKHMQRLAAVLDGQNIQKIQDFEPS